VSHTLADVLRKGIDLSKLPRETPPRIRELLRRSLDRDLKSRLQHISEARVAIDHAGAQPEAATAVRRTTWAWLAATVLFAAAFAALAFVHFSERLTEPPLRVFSFTPKDFPATCTIAGRRSHRTAGTSPT
jgi:hypothetical protein